MQRRTTRLEAKGIHVKRTTYILLTSVPMIAPFEGRVTMRRVFYSVDRWEAAIALARQPGAFHRFVDAYIDVPARG